MVVGHDLLKAIVGVDKESAAGHMKVVAGWIGHYKPVATKGFDFIKVIVVTQSSDVKRFL